MAISPLRSVSCHAGCLLYGERDCARLRDCTGRAIHGDGVGSFRCAGSFRSNESVSAASEDAASGQGYQEHQHSEHGAPGTPSRRDAEEQQAGQSRAASRVPGTGAFADGGG